MERLHKDELILILNNLDDEDLVNACRTNKAAYEICTNQNFWLQRIRVKFPEIPIDVLKKYKKGRSWSEYYIKDLRKMVDMHSTDILRRGANNGRLDYVMIALNNGANIHHGNDWAIRTASGRGDLEIVKYLASRGADIQANRNDAIMLAAEKGYLNIIKYLASLGANVHDGQYGINDQALRLASRNGHLDLVKYLVETHNLDFRADNNSAVIGADIGGHNDVVDYLVSQGAPDPRI